MAGFYSKFIHNYAEIVNPLNNLKCKGVKFEWTMVHEKAFENIKSALCSAPLLHFPNFNGEFLLQCDASDVAGTRVNSDKLIAVEN